MNLSIAFNPHLDLVWLAILGAIAAVAAIAALLSRGKGSVLRAGLLCLLVIALMNPSMRSEDREPLPGVVAVVLDRSQSQTLDQREAQTDEVRAQIDARLARMPDMDVRWITATSGTGSDGTELFEALSRGMADVPSDRIGGVILVTDGRVHDIPANMANLGFDAPVHVLLTGREDERDRRVVLHNPPRFGIVGEEKTVNFRIVETFSDDGAGTPSGRVRVTIRRDGQDLATRMVTPGETVSENIEVAHGGQNIFEVEVEEAENEITGANNRAVFVTEGIRQNLRVLLVSGEPHAGERAWRNILKSDATVDLVHFTILRPPEKQDGTPISQLSLIAFPTRELFQEKIDEFDLIIFDRYQRRGVLPVLYFDNIAEYVRNGGALLVAAGPDYASSGSLYRTPLAQVLPAEPTGSVTEEPYHPRLSDQGDRHPITAELEGAQQEPPAWSRWFRQVQAQVDRGNVLMNGPDDQPLLVVSREDEGRVALFLSDHTWLWARGFEGGGPYVGLLRRLSHWLMKEPVLEEEALTARTRGNSIVVSRRTMGDNPGPVRVTAPDDFEQDVQLTESQPGLFEGSMQTSLLGLYRITQGELTTLASVGPLDPRELTEVTRSSLPLSPAVEATGGAIFETGPAGDVSVPRILPVRPGGTYAGNGWIGIKPSTASVLHGVDALALLGGLLGMLLLLAALAGTWYREGR
ncbi:hypothetical protein ACKTEK_11445 [Tepidamorphus sp. 3E244]|uniref:hypothetical protein n=1 Tax=Tepidamorphus sp. 3E244 TaxID=3385498 RepID=UPI0038FC23ED